MNDNRTLNQYFRGRFPNMLMIFYFMNNLNKAIAIIPRNYYIDVFLTF
jgi:hypothetical protein